MWRLEGSKAMNNEGKSLNLSETFRHFNTLIWQVPSWGIAIAVGVIVAADQIGKYSDTWSISIQFIQASILFFGFFLLLGLTFAVYRFRTFQAASAPDPLPIPPFKQNPPAECFLQGALCLTGGGLLGLASVQVIPNGWIVVICLALGAIEWRIIEIQYYEVIEEINKKRKSSNVQEGTKAT